MNLDEKLDEILKEAWRQGYYTNNNTDTTHFKLATNDLKTLLSTAVREAIKQLIEEEVEDAIWHRTIGDK